MNAIINALRESAELRSIDVHLARFATSMDEQPRAAVLVAAAMASRALSLGDVCSSLHHCQAWAQQFPEFELPADSAQWRAALQSSAAFQPQSEQQVAVLVLDGSDRLYLKRYHGHEQSVAVRLREALGNSQPIATAEQLLPVLDVLFPQSTQADKQQPDWQRVAVAVAMRQRFSVISGGPGTGKTRTVARLLGLLQHFAPSPLRIALAAPTGKAAARLAQSIQREMPALQEHLPEAAKLVPTEASTLHRLLGYRSGGQYRHDANNPLALDVLLVDEASMLDLAMMARLLAAIPASARLVLLGDRDQLASVEAGNVLGDICAQHFDFASRAMLDYLEPLAAHAVDQLQLSESEIADGICLLRRSYRFDEHSAVGAVSKAINSGDWPRTQQLLGAGDAALLYLNADEAGQKVVGAQVIEHFRALLRCESAEQALQQLSKFQLLCGLRRGAAGVEELNAQMLQLLVRAGLASNALNHRGRPIMVVQNDYAQGLYNGDVGLMWPDQSGEIQAWFDDGLGGLRSVMPARLPEHESCYAMTIHKTQGSEFQRICIVLPDQVAPILTRQLLYTGVTRAREGVTLCGPMSVIEHMVLTSLQRQSGLSEALSIIEPA